MRHAGPVALWLLVAVGGCGRIAYEPHSAGEGGTRDAGSRDGGATGNDTGPLPSDAGIDPEVAAACDTRFGAATAYQLCWTEASACAFNAQTDPRNCATVCESFGSTCLAAYANSTDGDPARACITTGVTDCAGRAFDDICVCALP